MNADRRGAWELLSDGSYEKLLPSEAELNSQTETPETLGTFETLMRDAGR
jgi:hypothetical protein